MGLLKKLFLFLVLFFVLPAVVTVVLLKYAATPLTNWLLSQKVNAPAKVQKVELNWTLTELLVEKLYIGNPQGFPPGPMLTFDRANVKVDPKSYFTFKPYLSAEIDNLYFHFIRKSDNSTNVAVAFGLPYTKGKVQPLEFKIKKTLVRVSVNTLKEVNYFANGTFEGLGNDADFTFKGRGDLSDPQNPKTLTDFTVHNWHIRNNRVLSKLADILQKPELKDVTLTRIEGTVQTEGPWIIFAKRNTKAYTVGDVLFAEIYKGSKYNRLTKELDITMAVYIPAKVEIRITGTTDNPKVEVLNIGLPFGGSGLLHTNSGKGLLPGIPQGVTPPVKNPVEEIQNKTKETLKKVKETVDQTVEKVKEDLNRALQGLFGN